jgi:uncharacterized membrane protein YgcG
MTKTLHRALIGVAAAALAAGGGVGLAASPASAAPAPHVTVALSSGTVAPGLSKFVDVVITNAGPGEINDLRLVIDQSGLDAAKVSLFELRDCTPAAGGKRACPLDVTTLGAGQKATWNASLNSVSRSATGAAGHLDAHVEWSGGGSADKSFPLTVGGHGPDLRMDTPDAPQMLDDNGRLYVGKLGPGETGSMIAAFENFGDTPAGDLKLGVTLPAGAAWNAAQIKRFPEDYVGCTFTGRKAACDFGDLVLTPKSQITPDWIWVIGFPITLDATAKSGVNLPGGRASVTGTPVSAAKAALARKAAAHAPRGTLAEANAVLPTEVDGTDNSSGFAVLVKTFGQAGGGTTGGGTSGGGTSGGGAGSDGGGLPVTGPVAASAAGAGVVVLGVGTFLVLAARRRRVSFVPGDDR